MFTLSQLCVVSQSEPLPSLNLIPAFLRELNQDIQARLYDSPVVGVVQQRQESGGEEVEGLRGQGCWCARQKRIQDFHCGRRKMRRSIRFETTLESRQNLCLNGRLCRRGRASRNGRKQICDGKRYGGICYIQSGFAMSILDTPQQPQQAHL